MEPLSSVPSHQGTCILIADDHVLFNDGVKHLLVAYFPDIHQVFSGKDVESAVARLRPQLLLLDINLPGMDGLELSKRLKKSNAAPRIILLSMYNDQKFIRLAEEIGVEGYLLKSTTQSGLLSGIHAVLKGSTAYCTQTDPHNVHAKDVFMEKYKLTQRELEIIRLIKEGMSSAQIAESIYLSVYTVETHRRNINLKLNIKNPAELVRKAIEMGL
jgi:DNA-binding NarL/FixJ family response regulator